MKKFTFATVLVGCILAMALALNAYRATDTSFNTTVSAIQTQRTTVKTKSYPRAPYSGATYYIYERDGNVICTKIETCNKYDNCSSVYKKGEWKDEMDVEYDVPYGVTDPVTIAQSKLKRHVCLTKFKLLR